MKPYFRFGLYFILFSIFYLSITVLYVLLGVDTNDEILPRILMAANLFISGTITFAVSYLYDKKVNSFHALSISIVSASVYKLLSEFSLLILLLIIIVTYHTLKSLGGLYDASTES